MSKSIDNIGFAGINYQWFIGQVPPNQTLDKTDPDGWGDRVKVRIVGIHDKSGTVTPNDQLPWAIVERPTTQGNASRGSTGLTGGEWVRGYFLDPFNQVPVITAVLGRGTYENNISLEEVKTQKSTEFKNITRYNASQPHSGQVIGSDKPTEAAQPTKQDFDKAKEIPKDQKDIQNNKEKISSTPTTTSTGIPSEPTVRQTADGKWEVTTYKNVDGEREGFTRVTNEPPSQSVINAARFEQSQYYQNETNRLSVTQ
jgi:hypothetical protein